MTAGGGSGSKRDVDGREAPGQAGEPARDDVRDTNETVRVVVGVLLRDALRWVGYSVAILASIGIFLLVIYLSIDAASARQGLRLRRFAETRRVLEPGSVVGAADIRMRVGWIPSSSEPFGTPTELEGKFVTRHFVAGEVIESNAIAPRPDVDASAHTVTAVEVKPGLAQHIRPGMRVAFVSNDGEWPNAAQRKAGRAFEVLTVLQDASIKSKPTAILVVRVPAGVDAEAQKMANSQLTPIVLPPAEVVPGHAGEEEPQPTQGERP